MQSYLISVNDECYFFPFSSSTPNKSGTHSGFQFLKGPQETRNITCFAERSSESVEADALFPAVGRDAPAVQTLQVGTRNFLKKKKN